MRKNKTIIAATLILVMTALIFTGCDKEPEQVDATSFSIEAQKILIADPEGNIEVKMSVEPAETYPLDFSFTSSDEEVATATVGAIDDNGNVVTAAQVQQEKDELAETDKDAAEEIIVPTGSAIISAHGYGECTITGSIGGIESDVKVIVADKQIALTFDDGAAPPTEKLLNGLAEHDVKATFFVVGEMTRRDKVHEDALARAIEDGYEIANHTYNHVVGTTNIESELAQTDKLIEDLGGGKTTLMRPPGGAMNSAIQNCGKAIILWSLDTMDWKYRDPNHVKNELLKSKDGDIVLMHDLHETSVEGALQAIPELKKQGFYMTTVSDMLGDLQPNQVYREGEPGRLETTILL